jgi:hypothetical protein
MQHFLNNIPELHGHGSLRPSFSNQLLVSVHDAHAALHALFGWETALSFTGGLESSFRY